VSSYVCDKANCTALKDDTGGYSCFQCQKMNVVKEPALPLDDWQKQEEIDHELHESSHHRIKFTLQYPPTLNTLYPTSKSGRRYKSAKCVQFHKDAHEIMEIAGSVLSGRICVKLQYYRPMKRGDLDNVVKVVLDAMKGICYTDDEQVKRIIADMDDDKKNPRVEVEVWEL